MPSHRQKLDTILQWALQIHPTPAYLCRPVGWVPPSFGQNDANMAKKGNRIQVIMECTEHKASGMPGTSRYITTKNRKNTTERLELKKFNPILRRVTVHKEIK